MARRKKAVAGLINELAVQLDFAKDPNILVFTPLGGLGPVDIVTLNMTTGEYTAYDVKSKNYFKLLHLLSVSFFVINLFILLFFLLNNTFNFV